MQSFLQAARPLCLFGWDKEADVLVLEQLAGFLLQQHQHKPAFHHLFVCGHAEPSLLWVITHCLRLLVRLLAQPNTLSRLETTVQFVVQFFDVDQPWGPSRASKQRHLLHVLACDAGRVVTHRRLLGEVWGAGCREVQYLRVYMRQLRAKIEKDAARPKRLQTVLGVGYRCGP